jgi:hypothetical protein
MYPNIHLCIGNKKCPDKGYVDPFFKNASKGEDCKTRDREMIGGMIGNKTITG